MLSVASEPVHSEFAIGGVCVRLSACAEADLLMIPPLDRFVVEECLSDVNIQIEWIARIDQNRGQEKFDSGTTWRLYEGDERYSFDFNSGAHGTRPYQRLITDKQFSRVTLQMSQEYLVRASNAAASLGYPLDELLIMHRLTQERGIELHSSGIVGPNGASNLFVGHSGAGKSTTTRLWTAHEGVEVLSDDRIIVREQAGQMVMYGTPWHGEAAFASPGSAPLKRIFILEQGLGNKLYRLTPMQAVSELFARSFVPFYEPKYVDAALDFLQSLTDVVPCYRYVFEPNQAAVEKILEFSD